MIDCAWSMLSSNIVQAGSYGVVHQDGKSGSFAEPINDAIINNLIFGGTEDALCTGSQSITPPISESTIHVYNNTLLGRARAFRHIRNAVEHTGQNLDFVNNILQGSMSDYNADEVLRHTALTASNNISEDASLQWAQDIHEWMNQQLRFANKPQGIYQLNMFEDYAAVDDGDDLSSSPLFRFTDDIGDRPREPGLWDIGAFELISIFGFGNLYLGSMISNAGLARVMAVVTQEIFLYHGTMKKIGFENVTFNSITEVNDWLATHASSLNIIVSVEPSQVFSGTFAFGAHPIRSVTVQTDPAPDPRVMTTKPASIDYTTTLIDDASSHISAGGFSFTNLKVYTTNNSDSFCLLGDAAATRRLIFENSIVQVAANTITGICGAAVVARNSELVYLNKEVWYDAASS